MYWSYLHPVNEKHTYEILLDNVFEMSQPFVQSFLCKSLNLGLCFLFLQLSEPEPYTVDLPLAE